jgi:uncharacterized protein YndB with AHSA1/START domain
VAPKVIETDRTVVVAASPERVWEVLSDVPAYPSFWPWLRRFDGRHLVAREEWSGSIVVAGPLRMRIGIHLTEVTTGRRVRAIVRGTVMGAATIETRLHDGGTALHLTANLVPRPLSPLALLTRASRPLAQASHDRVIARALDQLTAHLSP